MKINTFEILDALIEKYHPGTLYILHNDFFDLSSRIKATSQHNDKEGPLFTRFDTVVRPKVSMKGVLDCTGDSPYFDNEDAAGDERIKLRLRR